MLAVLLVMAGACARQRSSQASFKALPASGWHASLPLKWTPTPADSAGRYDVTLAVRHTGDYPFNNLRVAVDMIDSAHNVTRRNVDFTLADRYGNWQGAGFGALYQASAVVAQDLPAHRLRQVVAWQAMSHCTVVKNVTEVGLIITPASPEEQ